MRSLCFCPGTLTEDKPIWPKGWPWFSTSLVKSYPWDPKPRLALDPPGPTFQTLMGPWMFDSPSWPLSDGQASPSLMDPKYDGLQPPKASNSEVLGSYLDVQREPQFYCYLVTDLWTLTCLWVKQVVYFPSWTHKEVFKVLRGRYSNQE